MTDEYRRREGEKTVTLEVYESEPLARMAASRLESEGIRCMVRSVGLGPGFWGPAANIPHALDTWPEDADRALEVLDLKRGESEERNREMRSGSMSTPQMLFLFVLAMLALGMVLPILDTIFGALLW